MTTMAYQETRELKQRLAQLNEARKQTRHHMPWLRSLIRNDLEELHTTLVDLERGYGPNIGRLPALLHRDRYRYLRALERTDEAHGHRVRVMAPAENHLSEAA